MSLTTTETLGFADGVIEFLTNPGAPGLQAAGLNVSTYITELGTQKEDAVTKNDQREALKAQLRTKTDEVNPGAPGLGTLAGRKPATGN